MKEPTKRSPHDRGEVVIPGRCQVCGAEGPIVAVPEAPPPNELCARCAIEYGGAVAAEDDGR